MCNMLEKKTIELEKNEKPYSIRFCTAKTCYFEVFFQKKYPIIKLIYAPNYLCTMRCFMYKSEYNNIGQHKSENSISRDSEHQLLLIMIILCTEAVQAQRGTQPRQVQHPEIRPENFYFCYFSINPYETYTWHV